MGFYEALLEPEIADADAMDFAECFDDVGTVLDRLLTSTPRNLADFDRSNAHRQNVASWKVPGPIWPR
jgi:hypothetical protein